jgi:hypothetical protein
VKIGTKQMRCAALIDTVRDKDRIKAAINTVPHASNRARLNRWIKFRARRARIPGACLMALAGMPVAVEAAVVVAA